MRTQVVGSWSAVDTPVSGVEEAIRRLRQRHDRGAVRTAVASLVVLVGEDRAEAANLIDVVPRGRRPQPDPRRDRVDLSRRRARDRCAGHGDSGGG